MKMWLLLSVESPTLVGVGYDDNPSEHYSWDSTVPNHALPRRGDLAVLWDKEVCLGYGQISQLAVEPGMKRRPYCPGCRKAGIHSRKKLKPRYKCANNGCGEEFEDPVWKTISITAYRAVYPETWQEPKSLITAAELREACEHPKSQQSIRGLVPALFLDLLARKGESSPRIVLSKGPGSIEGGHVQKVVRVRRGQQAFRRALEKQYGENCCAITGPAPREAIEAAHLYSFASTGSHDEFGGLLLRRDLHSLLDRGLLRVDVASMSVELAEHIRDIGQYKHLHRATLTVKIRPRTQEWLAEHYRMSSEHFER